MSRWTFDEEPVVSKELENKIESILKLVADPTRRKILDLLSDEPRNPQDLADQLSISRPAIEKHLKLLISNYLCERRVDPFPSPHYVYFISIPGIELLDNVQIETLILADLQHDQKILNEINTKSCKK